MTTPSDQDQPINPLIEARRRHARPKSRRGRKWIIAGGVVVFLILFGFLGLPPIVKSQAVKHLSAALGGRTVTIEKVRINPLVLSATIEGFAIADLDGSPFVGWRRLYVNFDSFSIFTGQWRFQTVELDDFSATVALGADGRPNFHDLIPSADPAATPEPESAEAPEPPRPLYVGRLAISGARVDFADASRAAPFATTLGPVSFELTRFNTSGDARAPYQFDAVTESGERLAWSGTVSLDPMRSQGELRLADIRLDKYAPYHAPFHNADLQTGLLDLSGRYEVDLSGDQPRASLADGTLTLREFALALRGAADPLLTLDRLALTGISADLAANTARIDRIALDGGRARVQRAADGTLNLQQLLPVSASGGGGHAAGAPPPAASAQPLPDFTLGELAVNGFAIDIEDLSNPRPASLGITSLDFTLADFALLRLDQKLPLGLRIAFNAGGTLDLTGEAALQPLSAAAQLTLADLDLTPFGPYVEPFVNIRLASGLAGTAGSVLLQDGALTYTGSASLAKLVTVDPLQAENFVTLGELALNGLRFHSAPLALHLDQVILTEPTAALLINADGTLNLAAALTPASTQLPSPGTPTSSSASATPAPPDITIDRVEFRSARFAYEDRSLQPAARTALTLDGTVTGLSSAQLARADVNLTGQVDGSAPIAITGQLNPLGQPAYSKLTIDFTGIDLPAAAGPYLGKYAGYELDRGRLTLDIDFDLQNRKITSANVITLDQFTLGARTDSPDATKLPVSLAIALLKDSSGQIVLDVPVKGSLDDPQFKIGRVVLRVITNVLVKAATSPFSLLGAAFGGGGDELAYQQVLPGAVEPAPEELKKLETVAKALLARPALLLDIQGSHDPAGDRAALQQARLQSQLRARLWEQLRATTPGLPPPDELAPTPEQNAQLLLELYAETFPAKEGAALPVMATSDGALLAAPADKAEPAPSRPVARRFGPRAPATPSRTPAPSPADTTAPVILPVPEGTPGAPSELMTSDGVPVLTPEIAAAKLAAAIEITDDDLRALADARAQAVRAWLTGPGQVPADRVFIIAPAAKGHRVDFNLR